MWLKKIYTFLPIITLVFFVVVLFLPVWKDGKLPIPADTIVGLYHPWRDSLAENYPNGVPFKNFQITDPVRQQFPWRELSIENLKAGELPLWNPYNFSGSPLMGNLQSAPLYPGNLLFFILDFVSAWTILIILQIILGGLFLYLYLKEFKLSPVALSFGVLAWVGSGFFVAWQQWGTVVQTAIWIPLILLSVDKIISGKKIWTLIFVISFSASFLAGYLQPFFYIFLMTNGYILFRLLQTKHYKKSIIFLVLESIFLILILPQAYSTFQFIGLSARDVDQSNWMRPDWFLPFENLIQLIAPDYFGNPATLNYFGVWNYQEFVAYIGLAPLLFAVLGLLFWRDKTSLFFKLVFVVALLFALPTPIGKLPFLLNMPFISTAQPSRLVMLICFTLSIFAAFGVEYFLNHPKEKRRALIILAVLFSLIGTLLLVKSFGNEVSFRNMYLPISLSIIITLTFLFAVLLKKIRLLLVFVLLLLTFFELLRFGTKFLPFTSKDFLYPKTKVIEFLQKNTADDHTRVAAVDERIFAPNTTLPYKLQLVSGYDPLYLRKYGEFIAAMERGEANSDAPFGFNRIITPKNYNSKFFDLLGVKYIVSLDPVVSQKYSLVFEEGATKVYENNKVLPRAFFPKSVVFENDKKRVFSEMFRPGFNPKVNAVISGPVMQISSGSAKIRSYKENEVIVDTQSGGGYLVLTDAYYPIWHAEVDGKETVIYPADHIFRAVYVPAGKHKVRFFAKLF